MLIILQLSPTSTAHQAKNKQSIFPYTITPVSLSPNSPKNLPFGIDHSSFEFAYMRS